MKTHKFVMIAAVAAAAAMVLAGCSSGGTSSPTSTPSKSPILIGFNDGLTGDDASLAQANLKIANAAINYTNLTGGIGGRKVKLESLDSGDVGSGKPSGNAIQLTQQSVVAILGPTTDGDCATVFPIVNKAQVPDLCNYVLADQNAGESSYVFSSSGSLYGAIDPQMKFLKKETGKSDPRVAILGNVVPGVVLQMKKIAATAKAEGIDVVYSEAMSGTDSSVATYTAGILAAKPDAVWFDIFAPFTGPLVSGIRGAGLKSIPIETVVAGVNYAQLAATADPHLFVTTGANYVFPGKSSSSPELKTLLKALAQAGLTSVASINTGAGPTQLAADLAVLNALKVCGPSCTGAELHKKLLTTTFSFPGLVEGFKFEVNRHDGFNSLKFWSWDAASGAAKLRSTLPVGSSSPTSP